ncbi:MAG: hypothetical protein RIC55_34855 [Pirellulaceae bacterium]
MPIAARLIECGRLPLLDEIASGRKQPAFGTEHHSVFAAAVQARQTFAAGGVMKKDGPVAVSNQHTPSVGRDRGHACVLVQVRYGLPGGKVPNDRLLCGAYHHAFPASIESHRVHGAENSRKLADELARFDVPEFEQAARSSQHESAVWRKHCQTDSRVPFVKRTNPLSGRRVPDRGGVLLRGRQHPLSVRAEGDALPGIQIHVHRKGLKLFSGFKIPHYGFLVPRA